MNKFSLFFVFCFCSTILFGQNITNTLADGGVFYIKDATTDFLTLTQSTKEVNILNGLRLELTGNSTSGTGVIFKGTDRFIHDFKPPIAGGNNTFVGINSGNFIMTADAVEQGSDNTGFGFNSLTGLTNGRQNTALGSYSSVSTTTGSFNTASGYQSLFTNTTGYKNSAFGNISLYSNANGHDNASLGYQSLYSNVSGNFNTAVGTSALASSASGNQNTAIGYGAGNSIISGSNNIVIGYLAAVPDGAANNQVRIGSTAITYAGVQVAWTVTSDLRWKENIIPSKLGLNFISKLNPVSYTRKNDDKQKIEYGLIAQELDEVLKNEGLENLGMLTTDSKGYFELRYNDLLAPMIKAIQELKNEKDLEIAELKSMNKSLAGENQKLISKISLMETKIDEVKTLFVKLVNSSEEKSEVAFNQVIE